MGELTGLFWIMGFPAILNIVVTILRMIINREKPPKWSESDDPWLGTILCFLLFCVPPYSIIVAVANTIGLFADIFGLNKEEEKEDIKEQRL
jgi:hypothetical protein